MEAATRCNRMWHIFSLLSAEVDWCEPNFEHSEYIAEYYNTLSNVAFFVMAPVLLWLNKDYATYRPWPVRCSVILLMLVGLFSFYYHLTLSYAGQLLDELSILWGLSLSYAFWFPASHFPAFIKNRNQLLKVMASVITAGTLLSFVKPALNAYILNCIALHLLYVAYQEVRKCDDPVIQQATWTMVGWWGVSISCWLVDKFLCSFCQRIHFCYFHSFWHIFITIALHYCATLAMLLDLHNDLPESGPSLEYWPGSRSPLALPYVSIQTPLKGC